MRKWSRVRGFAIAAAGALAASMLVAVAPSAAQAADTATISGQVTASTGGAPKGHATTWVYAIPVLPGGADDTGSARKSAAPIAADGSYTIAALPAGTYKVGVTAVGYCPQYWNNAGSLSTATPVALATSSSTQTDIDLKLTAGCNPTVAAAKPSISGKLAAGSTVTAKPGAWTSGAAFSYQWYANGKAIAKATTTKLKLTKTHVGKRISVRVTGAKSGHVSAAKVSATSPRVIKAVTPKVTGTKKIGSKLKAVPGTWTKGTKFRYQWLADGKPITKATKSTLKVTRSLKAKKITVQVTGRKAGYATVSKTSTVPKRTARWIEVDLSSQRMFMHENGKVIATHKVSTGTRAHPTETGTYRIFAKLKKQNMGCVARVDYCTKNVPWVMYYNGDQALHGAYWHNNFGRVMSHGCVNLPVSVAKKLYGWAKVGTTVVVHR